MENSWLTIILVIIVIGGMAFFIMISTANDVDKVTEASVQQDLSKFVKECANEGCVSSEKLLDLQSSINSHGILFEIKIWVERQSNTLSKKTTQLNNGTTDSKRFITEEYSVKDIEDMKKLMLQEDNILGIEAENITPVNEDNYSGNTGKEYATMKPQAVETVHRTGTN